MSAAFFTHQAGRAVLGVVLPQIKEDLNIADHSSMGLVSTCLSVTLAVMIPISGFLGDRLSRKWIITLTLIIGSAATALAGAAVGLLTLILFYSVTSASCEALYAPSGWSLLGSFHKETRTIAMAIHQSALYIGVVSCGFLAGLIAQVWGWRWAFAAFGGIGVVLGVIFIFRLKDAPREVSPDGVEVKPKVLETLKVLATTPSALLLTLGFTAIVFVNVTYCTWAPLFVQHRYGLSPARSGASVFAYHFLAAMVAILCGGLLTDRVVKSDVSHAGGITELRKIAAIAESYHVPFCPHNPSGPVANAATLQLAASQPGFYLLETMATDVPYRREICSAPVTLCDGYMAIPDTPGLGVDIDEAAIARYPYQPIALRHYDGTLTAIRPQNATEYFSP